MNYKNINLNKNMYREKGGFSGALERMDPSGAYKGSEFDGYDAFERQLKRFDIKVKGENSAAVEKFFATANSAALFPEYVARAVSQGAAEENILKEIIAAKTDINSLDYRSITTDLDSNDALLPIGEGETVPETDIKLNENLVRLVKRGRILKASYEAIKFQRIDVFSVALKQIGADIARAQLKDAVGALIGGGALPKAEEILAKGAEITYSDLLELWSKFDNFEMNVMLASPDTVIKILAMEEMKNPLSGIGFEKTGQLATPLGAKLIKSSAVPAGTVIGLDKRFALEMVTAGGVSVEYDKLIDTQLERAAVTAISGFSKIFPDAVKILKLK